MRKDSFKGSSLYEAAHDLGVNYLKLIKNNFPNPMVMFDIDDTLLNVNDDGSLSPIKPIIKLLKYCLNNGFIVLILTARDSRYLKGTKNDLKENGIDYDYLYLRKSPEDDHQFFKSEVKRKYTEQGFTVVMSIGDNDIDIIGDYSGYSIKLPNKTDPRLFHINAYGQLQNVIP
jgi:predicted secreted acid phosphatase